MVACICHSPLHHQTPDFEGQSVIKTSSYLLPFVLEAHRESLPRSCETSARRLSAESAEVYSTANLPASAAHTFPSHWREARTVWGGRKTNGWGVSWTISEFSASTPTGRMAQNDRTRGGVFHGKMDRCRGTQGWITTCSGMPERDGKDQGEDSPKQAGLCWFACPC